MDCQSACKDLQLVSPEQMPFNLVIHAGLGTSEHTDVLNELWCKHGTIQDISSAIFSFGQNGWHMRY